LKGTTMKRLILIAMVVVFSGFFSPAKSQQVDVSLFYSPLSEYGEWVDCSYGHVWRPLDVQTGWRPYMYGRWEWTDNGWYWMSDEPFGWATFHYGRWIYDDYYGWLWAPDDVWGPSWVEWRYSDDYIGWAPLPPAARYTVSAGIYFDATWNAPIHYWSFVPSRNFTSTRIVDYVQPVERTRRFFGATRSVRVISGEGDRIVNRGIDVSFVEHRTHTTVTKIDIDARTTGTGERFVQTDGRQRIEVYRPRFTGETRGAAVRTEEHRDVNRGEVIQQEHATRRHMEVQRNAPVRRETFQQPAQPQQQQRRVEPQRTVQQPNRQVQHVQRPSQERREMRPQQRPPEKRDNQQPTQQQEPRKRR